MSPNDLEQSQPSLMPRFQFTTTRTASSRFSPRTGNINFSKTSIETPTSLTSTSRGVVPHLTRDHIALSPSIKWVHVPFETFLERDPPIPTQLPPGTSFRSFLGFKDDQVLSVSLRDPWGWKELPANGNGFVSAHCIRGVRKVTPAQYRYYISKVQPDIVFALPDVPYTPPPFSQKRITKSIEKTTNWLADILQAPAAALHASLSAPNTGGKIKKNNVIPVDTAPYVRPENVFVHLAGDVSEAARRAFAGALVEKLHGKEAEAVEPLKCLDEGVSGYVLDLAPLRKSLLANEMDLEDGSPQKNNATKDIDFNTDPHTSKILPSLVPLLRASLDVLPPTKPRLVTGTQSPHEVLQLLRDVAVDVFDTRWAQRAADWGIALDFEFPVRDEGRKDGQQPPRVREDGLKDLGHNLYDSRYAMDFSSFSSGQSPCACFACAPAHPYPQLLHSSLDSLPLSVEQSPAPFTRAYIHHLLHTHEMSAHALLVGHNLAVLDEFFVSVRNALTPIGLAMDPGPMDEFEKSVQEFSQTYDSSMRVFAEAKRDWGAVEYSRGKGRLAREKHIEKENANGSEKGDQDKVLVQ